MRKTCYLGNYKRTVRISETASSKFNVWPVCVKTAYRYAWDVPLIHWNYCINSNFLINLTTIKGQQVTNSKRRDWHDGQHPPLKGKTNYSVSHTWLVSVCRTRRCVVICVCTFMYPPVSMFIWCLIYWLYFQFMGNRLLLKGFPCNFDTGGFYENCQ